MTRPGSERPETVTDTVVTDRRRLLATVGAGVTTAVAGCSGVSTGGEAAATDRAVDDTDASPTAATAAQSSLALPSAVTTGGLPDGDVTLRPTGSVTLLNFFATWCAPCKKEMPALRKLREAYDESELHMVSVTPQVETEVVASFWAKHDATWPAVTDSSLRASQRWDATSYPTNLLFDRDGAPAGDVDARTFGGFETAVAPLIEEA